MLPACLVLIPTTAFVMSCVLPVSWGIVLFYLNEAKATSVTYERERESNTDGEVRLLRKSSVNCESEATMTVDKGNLCRNCHRTCCVETVVLLWLFETQTSFSCSRTRARTTSSVRVVSRSTTWTTARRWTWSKYVHSRLSISVCANRKTTRRHLTVVLSAIFCKLAYAFTLSREISIIYLFIYYART